MDLGFSVKIKHKIKLSADAKPFRRAYRIAFFEKRKAMEKIKDYLEKGDLVETTHSSSVPSILVKKKTDPTD